MIPERRTYVVLVRQHGGPTTIEEVRTGRKAQLRSLSDVAAQIERWLKETVPPPADPTEERR
jgi:hypothetical protein